MAIIVAKHLPPPLRDEMRFLLVSALAALFASARAPQKVLVTAPPAYAERLAAKLARLGSLAVELQFFML